MSGLVSGRMRFQKWIIGRPQSEYLSTPRGHDWIATIVEVVAVSPNGWGGCSSEVAWSVASIQPDQLVHRIIFLRSFCPALQFVLHSLCRRIPWFFIRVFVVSLIMGTGFGELPNGAPLPWIIAEATPEIAIKATTVLHEASENPNLASKVVHASRAFIIASAIL